MTTDNNNSNNPQARLSAIRFKIYQLQIWINNCQVTSRKDKDYIKYDEEITKLVLQLDDVISEEVDVRQERRRLVDELHKLSSELESKIHLWNSYTFGINQ